MRKFRLKSTLIVSSAKILILKFVLGQRFKQMFVSYKPYTIPNPEHTCIMFDVRSCDPYAKKKDKSLGHVGWALMPVFDDQGFFRSG